MKKTVISVVALSLAFSIPNALFAQDNATSNKNKQQGEIVMTQQELDDFLEKIANYKRQQLEKRRNELILNRKIENKMVTDRTVNTVEVESIEDDYGTNKTLLRELDRINSRIDLLMLNSGNVSRTYVQPNSIPVQTPIVYPNTTPVVNTVPYVAPNTNVVSDETEYLRNRVNVLNEELRVLNALSNNGKDEAYRDEISALNRKILALDSAMNNRVHTSTTNIYKVSESDELRKGLENYSKKIYFANNSTTVSSADMNNLKEVVDIVNKNAPRVTAVLRGYASKKGSAMYNNNISFERAEAVKKVLLNYGLSAKDITTLHHGIDEGNDEAHARRVEVTLLVQ